MDLVNTLWVEKYRPKSVDEIVLPKDYEKEFKKYINNQELPNLLLYGPPGGGKSTIARILCSKEGLLEFPNDNLLELNGSAKDTRGINFTNDVIEPFLKIPPAGTDKYKVVFIDEADHLTDASFHSLRGIIEKYASYGRFIFTCNYISKIPEAIQSRLIDYKLKQVSEDFVVELCEGILNNEKIKFENNDVKFIVENLYPDIRKIIGRLQRFSTDGELQVNRDIALTKENFIVSSIIEVINFIKNDENHKVGKVVNSILETINDMDIDYREIYTKLFFNKSIPVPFKLIVNKYSNTHNNCLVDTMHFMGLIFEGIQELQKYSKMVK